MGVSASKGGQGRPVLQSWPCLCRCVCHQVTCDCFGEPLHPEGGCQVGVLEVFVLYNWVVLKLCGDTAAQVECGKTCLHVRFFTVP